MNTRILLVLCLALGGGWSARAADAAAATAAVPEIDHMVYLSFLPAPDELMADAKANGLDILRVDKTADRVVVTYKYPDGHTATLGYALLSSAGDSDKVAYRTMEVVDERPVAVRRTVVVEDDPDVVYVERPYRTRVVYRDRYDDFWLPLTLGLGVGYITGHHSHHYGGYVSRHGWRGRGWRR